MSSVLNDVQVHTTVRDHYGAIARGDVAGCAPGCCPGPDQAAASARIGYDAEALASLPAGADLGLGCGNPQAIAALRPGETVLDLGSGAGIDCFLAARQVGPTGAVIGVDMTPDMIDRARRGAAELAVTNVDFRLGQIEHLPVADASVDVVLSNCVVNLSPDKAQVYRDVARVLKPGGRVAISDVVAIAPLPAALRKDVSALTGCVAGAATLDELRQALGAAGFIDVTIDVKEESRALIAEWFPGTGLERYVASASIQAVRPTEAACCAPTCCDEPDADVA